MGAAGAEPPGDELAARLNTASITATEQSANAVKRRRLKRPASEAGCFFMWDQWLYREFGIERPTDASAQHFSSRHASLPRGLFAAKWALIWTSRSGSGTADFRCRS